jgi:hypothetical protein
LLRTEMRRDTRTRLPIPHELLSRSEASAPPLLAPMRAYRPERSRDAASGGILI